MKPKVFNKRDPDVPADAVYVGRPTKFGNQFMIGRDGTRMDVIRKFRHFAERNMDYCNMVKKELQGKHLVCWCAPRPCHADVLLEIANS